MISNLVVNMTINSDLWGQVMKQLLKEIAEVSAGQGAPQGDSNYCEDGIPFVKAGNLLELTEGKSIHGIQKVSEAVAKKYRLRLYKKGTILFAKSGMSCLKGYVYVLPCDAYVVSHLACVTPKEDISEYLKYYFCYHRPNQLVKDEAYPSISLSDIGCLEINTQDATYRDMVVTSLWKISSIIEMRKQQLSELDNLVKARFVELFGSIKNNHQRYPVVKIGSCAKLQGGFAFKSSDYLNDGIRLVQISNVNKDTLDWDSINCVPQAFLQKYKDFELHVGDLVLAMTRPVIKSLDAVKIATVSENDVPSLLNQRVGRFVVDRKKLHSVYLMVLCQMPEFREYVEAMSGNSLQPNISSKQVEDYSIVLPPLALQEQFAAFIQQTDKSKAVVQKALDEAQTLFDSLMQQYFG